MPTRPASRAQLGFVHAEAERGAPWAQQTVSEWHGKTFGHLPARKKKRSLRHLLKKRRTA